MSAISESENCTPLFPPQMMPAASATMPATAQTMTQMPRSEMPTESAAAWSSATARSARPTRVRWKKMASTMTRTAAMPAAKSSKEFIRMPDLTAQMTPAAPR